MKVLEPKHEVFFSKENGLTMTSANHIANKAKEMIRELDNKLESMDFVTTKLALLDGGQEQLIQEGMTAAELEEIHEISDKVSKMHALMAWLREAIKAKELTLAKADNLDLRDYCNSEVEGGYPERPSREDYILFEDMIARMNVKERCEYLALEARLAVLGKLIHPRGSFANARAEMLRTQKNKCKVEGTGRDTIIYNYTPSIEYSVVEDAYNKLFNEHREKQAEMNRIRHEYEEKMAAENLEIDGRYDLALGQWNATIDTLNTKYEIWRKETIKELRDMKIVIPNNLKEIYDYVNKH